MNMILRSLVLLLVVTPALAQEEAPEKKKKKGPPVPEFDGVVRLVLTAEIIPSEHEPTDKKQVLLDDIRNTLKMSEIKHEAGSREIGIPLKGTYADAARIHELLKKAKIHSEIRYPARVVLMPRVKITGLEKLAALVEGIEGVDAAGTGRQWGLPDPTIGILSAGTVLDARPIVHPNRKYVTLTTGATNSTLEAMLTLQINPVIAFADLDKVSPNGLAKAMGFGARSPSHRDYTFSFSKSGDEDKARDRVLSIKGVIRISFAEDKVLVIGSSRLSRFRVKSVLRKYKYKDVEDVR